MPIAGPARPSLRGDPFAQLAERHAALGVRVDAQTAFPRWDGTRADYDLVVQALVRPVPSGPLGVTPA